MGSIGTQGAPCAASRPVEAVRPRGRRAERPRAERLVRPSRSDPPVLLRALGADVEVLR
ncbi:hypothetical protein [Kineococcus arenarius]|uniref:hypothetical protein n=1 Tax=Kineococcus sp. SYSU DK007 TaxID=3383128 RepID=UPI003D7E2914